MYLAFLGPLMIVSSVFAVQTRPEEDYYYAAVVEYSPLEGIDGNDTILKNAKEYTRIIKKAAESVDIVVFPETALNFEDTTVYLEVPFGENEVPPADNPSLHPVLRILSQAARDNKIYVSVAILEKELLSDKEIKHNTNIVFDRNGKIVLRYRKFNLFQEGHVEAPKEPELATFTSDFGVRFGAFICKDIYFKDPALTLVYEKNITDFIYPSWFFSILQLGTSIQLHFGWAYATDSNLLSSGVNSLEQGSTGSGIYAGKKGAAVYIYGEKNETRILTAKLYKKGKTGKSEGKILEPLTEGIDNTLAMEPENFENYETYPITPKELDGLLPEIRKYEPMKHELIVNKIYNKTICQGSLCCEFNIDTKFTYEPLEYLNMSSLSFTKNDSFYHHQYRLATFNGIRVFPDTTSGIQVCGIISCLNDSMESCGQNSGNALPLQINSPLYGHLFLSSTVFKNISIKAVSREKTDFTFPSILESSNSESPKAYGSLPEVSKINFRSDGFLSSLQFSSEKLMYLSIYSRIISRDGRKAGPILDTEAIIP